MATPANAVSGPGQQASLVDWMNYEDSLVRTQQYEFLGRVKVIVLEAAQGVHAPDASETSKVGLRMDFYNNPLPRGGTADNSIPIAQSLGKPKVLVLLGGPRGTQSNPFVRRDGRVGLPDIPDPAWKPTATAEAVEGKVIGEELAGTDEKGKPYYRKKYAPYAPPEAPLIAQPLELRRRGYVNGAPHLWVFGPIHQILFQPELNGERQATYWTLEAEFDPATRTWLELVIDMNTGAGYFYGGRFSINRVG
jgi:hypothetical protein